ncbi:hypothetical protein DL93DRAFT_2088551 [Clavulina sp. PMI_390]|nr:hypothetical protein DL93DRAFT_2088551 [Clavulina sp. PMI_390]
MERYTTLDDYREPIESTIPSKDALNTVEAPEGEVATWRPYVYVLSTSATRWFWTAFCVVLATFVTQSYRSKLSDYGVKAPSFASRVLQECDALLTIPGTAPDFHKRFTSDRFEAGTKHTLITNATIWTGSRHGQEIIWGGSILLENGVIRSVEASISGDLLAMLSSQTNVVNAAGAWVTPALFDIHSHAGVQSIPMLRGSADGNSQSGIAQPWLRNIDGIDTHDISWELSRAGGVGSALILPGSINAIGGQAFVVKTRATKERSTLSMLLEPPNLLVSNGSSLPLRWRHMKHAVGENPSRVHSGTRMDTIWKLRESYNEARKIMTAQDAYCAKAKAGHWAEITSTMPTELKWEALVDVLRGKVKVNVHIYETVDITSIVGLSNEFKFPFAVFHHADEAYLVPELLKQSYGKVPALAIFAVAARYKKESYRGSEFAAKVLSDSGILVAMKSDSPAAIHSRFLAHEAAQAHHYGLDEITALRAITTIPAEAAGMGHRVGYLKPGWDADVVIWDSHPLTLGATPTQVFIDGIPQLSSSFSLKKPPAFHHAPKTPDFDEEQHRTLDHDGLPPLSPNLRLKNDRVAFVNVKSYWRKDRGQLKIEFDHSDSEDLGRTIVFEHGRSICVSSSTTSCAPFISERTHRVDLAGGSLSPGMTTIGSGLGLVDIVMEVTTGDGIVQDPASGVGFDDASRGMAVRASDGLLFETRDALIAYRSGVTSAISAPESFGFFRGISSAFSISASNKLQGGALRKEFVALYVAIVRDRKDGTPSVSTQIGMIRRGLLGGFGNTEWGEWFRKVLDVS